MSETPQRFDRHKHTRRAFRYGRQTGHECANVADPHELDESYVGRGVIDDVESGNWRRVGHQYATDSRDIGGARGLHRLERIQRIGRTGAVACRFIQPEHADSCMIRYSGGSHGSGVITGDELEDDAIEAYDAGFAAGFADSISDRYE